ncbi:MAG: hypothetical protein KAR36_09285 [Candidatus Latescibacteria bacterium]|nr:hypothetical protein [Candidatus Latescibacterota bacterium]
MNAKWVATIGLFLSLLLMTSGPNAQTLNLSGYVRNVTGVLMEGDHAYSVLQNTLSLNLEHSRGNAAFKANPYLVVDSDKELELGLREAYLDIYFDSLDLRIGKQQIIWGKGDGVFITDIISPKDLREFLLPDFDEIRIGITALKMDYYLRDHTFEMVWVPAFTPTHMPEENSIWRVTPDFPIQPAFDYSEKEVEGILKNSELFVKYAALTSRVDFEIMAGTAWDDDPTLHTAKTVDPITKQLTSLSVTPKHHRLTLFGGSVSVPAGGFVFRGEGAYYRDKYFQSSDPLLSDGVLRKNYFHVLLGTDYTLWDVRLSAQFIQQAILNYDEQIVQDEFENTMTFLASKDFLRETLRVEWFSYLGLNHRDALIRPKITYDLADGFEILLGANIFVGSEGRFGQYDDNDMGVAKVKYSF